MEPTQVRKGDPFGGGNGPHLPLMSRGALCIACRIGEAGGSGHASLFISGPFAAITALSDIAGPYQIA